MDTEYQYINGIKMTVERDGHVTYYKTQDEMVSFMQYIDSENMVVLSGRAYGDEGRATAQRMFPKLAVDREVGGAADDDDGGFSCYCFYTRR